MVKEIQYTSIKRVLDNLTEHPLLRDLTLEQAIRHTIRFIGLHGYTKIYADKQEDIDIHEFRGMLPCDLISIIQVKDVMSGICLRSMTDNFYPPEKKDPCKDKPYALHELFGHGELAFKTQGRVIYTSFPEGKVTVAYKAIPVDDDGYPLLIDDESYLGALEAYIKKQVFTTLFDTGKFGVGKNSNMVLQNAQQDYAFLARQLNGKFQTPSVSEFESISRSLTAMIPRMREFDKGFRNLGDREYLRRHDNNDNALASKGLVGGEGAPIGNVAADNDCIPIKPFTDEEIDYIINNA